MPSGRDTIREAFDSMSWGPAPETASPAHAWLERHGRRLGHFIGGEFVAPNGGEWFPSINPARLTPSNAT